MSQTGTLMGFVHRRRRGAELFLLVLALAVGIGAYAAVGLGVEGAVPADIVGYGGWLTALIVAAHITVRVVAPYADPVLLPLVAALNGLGLAVIHRLDLTYEALGKDQHTFARQQLTWMTLGVVLFIVTLVLLRDHRVLQRLTYTAGLTGIVLLMLPFLPVIGRNINGARIWINVAGFSFQPGEVAKVMLVIAFSGYLVLHRDALALAGRRVVFIDLPRGRDLGPILAMFGISMMILVLQNDLGSSLLFFGLFLAMLYVATERPGWLVVGGAAVRRRRAGGVHLRRQRAEPLQLLAAPARLLRRLARQLPAGRGAVRAGLGRPDRPRLRQRLPRAGAVRLLRLHHLHDRRGARPDRGHGDHPLLRPDRRAGAAHRADLARRLRQAAWPSGSARSSRSRSSSSSAASPA